MVQSTSKTETVPAAAPKPRGPRSAKLPAARSTAASAAAAAAPAVRVRDAAATRQRILEAAIDEFAERGFSGARIDSIAQRSRANMRMIYHYYGNKEDLYVYVLDHVYEDIRKREASLNLANLDPFEAMMKLFDFTFSHFEANPHVIALWTGENLQKGLYLSAAPRAAKLTSPLVDAIRETLKRGEADAAFKPGIDPLQLYVSMVALSYFHLSNAYTLSAIFQTNLQSKKWRTERRRHAQDMLTAYLRHGPDAVAPA
jgi:TetR/AcrR family transcriptional regulator